ncbi:uncharacterized protein LOC135840154 [Planococcus citri]|uniref:uncharacterized protein LOC135840154 n=1 Tax=Planococcus citri TaxID=170843 RepID=UPI0031F95F4D
MMDRMKLLGCKDERKLMLAHQTCLELAEIDGLKNLVCNYDAELDLTYVTEDGVVDSANVFIPVHSTFSLTPLWIQNVQNKLSSTNPKSIILVIRESDTTFVRHKLSAGLIPSQVSCKKFHNARLDDTSDNETDNRRQTVKRKITTSKQKC